MRAIGWRLHRVAIGVFGLLLGVLVVTPDAQALSQFASAHGTKYGVSGSQCAFCHDGSPESRTNLNVYGRTLQGLGLSAADFNNLAKIGQTLDQAEPNFAPVAVGGRDVSVPAGASQITVTFGPGGNRGNVRVSDPIVPNTPNVVTEGSTSSFTFTQLSGTSVAINISLTPIQRGNLRRNAGANPHASFQFRPQNEDGFRPTVASTLAANHINLFFANQPPQVSDDSFSMAGDSPALSGTVLTQGGDGDPDGDPFRVEVVENVGSGTLSLNAGDGTFTYTPPPPQPQARTVTFTYRLVETGTGLASATATATITINATVPQNSPPVANDDAFDVVGSDPLIGNVITNQQGADTDPDAADVPLLSASVSTAPRSGSVVFTDGRGSFRYTPNPGATGDANGHDSFVYRLVDPSGRDDFATVTLTFVRRNSPPVVTAATLATINEQQGGQAIDLLSPDFVSDIDTPKDRLSVSNVVFSLSDESIVPRANVSPTLSGSMVTFDPAQFAALDVNQKTELVITYDVSDGEAAPVRNTLRQPVVGLDNGLGRIAGQYADTLRGRYNGHFEPASVQNDACHSCHNVGQVNVQVRTVAQCNATVFNPFGLALCLDRKPEDPPLVDLVRRLANAEAEFAPQLDQTKSIEVEESLPASSPVGPPLTAQQSPGKTFRGARASIVGFSFVRGDSLSAVDTTGQFRIANDGQITTVGALKPGVYTLDVRPINDAGQIDNAGNERPGIPGLFPVAQARLRFVTVTVRPTSRQPTDDVANTSQDTAVTVDVAANDGSGTATGVAVRQQPTSGSATVTGAGTIRYTPAAGFVGVDTFTYATVNAGVESAAAGTVTVTVVAAGGAVAVGDAARVVAGQSVLVDVAANDGGARPLTVSIVTPPSRGTAAVEPGGIRYQAPDGFTGNVEIMYRAANAIGASNAVLAITVSSVDGAVLEAGTRDPELKRVARAMGDTCAAINTAGAVSANQADLAGICEQLAIDVADGQDISSALSAIRNEEMFAAGEVMSVAGRLAGRQIFDRLDRPLASSNGVDVSGVTLAYGEQSLSGQAINDLIANAFNDGEDGSTSRWGFFMSGDIVFGDRDADAGSPGYDLLSASLSAGADYRFDDYTLLGGAVSYVRSDTSANGTQSTLDSDSVQVSLYGTRLFANLPGLEVNGVVSYGMTGFESDRQISFNANGQAYDRVAEADFDGRYLNIVPRLKYSWDTPVGARIGVFTTADYLAGWIDSFSERGAGGLALNVGDQQFESLVLSAGVEAKTILYTTFGTFQPFGKVSLNSDVLDDPIQISASFAALSSPSAPLFTITGAEQDNFYASLEVGTGVDLDWAQLRLSYGTTVGHSSMNLHRLTFGLGTSIFGSDMLSFDMTAAAQSTGDNEQMSMQARYQKRY
jgi:uncharacterized protein with beta-barrel porin domain